jgi:hypothetical protein
MLDTIPNGVINANSNVFLTKFSLKAVEPLPAPAEELLLLAPNPTSSTVYIQSLDSDFSAYQLEIYNSIGQLLSRQTKRAGIDLYPVDVSLVPDGVYVFVFSNGRKTITRRVLKQ